MQTATAAVDTSEQDRDWLGKVLPLLRVRRVLPLRRGCGVVALYPHALAVGRFAALPAIPEGWAREDGLTDLTAHLTAGKVFGLDRVTRVAVDRGGLLSNYCRGKVWSRDGTAPFDVARHEMQHFVRACALTLGDRFALRWRFYWTYWTVLFLLLVANAAVFSIVLHAPPEACIAPAVVLLGVVLHLVLDNIPRMLPCERLPGKKGRPQKDRSGRSPFRSPWLGWVLTVLAGAVLLPAVALQFYLGLAGWVITLPAVLPASMCLYLGYLLRQRPADFVLQSDTRPPVLYLRSFLDDGKRDFQPSGRMAYVLGVSAGLNVRRPWRYLFALHPVRILRTLFGRATDTSEEQLGLYLRHRGPFVAIGRPGEWFASTGASRMYVTNETWQQTVLDLLGQSQIVLVQPAKTAGIWWEIHKTLTNVDPRRILVCLINFWDNQNDYEAFRLMVEAEVAHPLPRLAGYTVRPAFLCFTEGGEAQLLVLGYKQPLLWPVLGTAIDLGTTLRPFFDRLDGNTPPPPQPHRRYELTQSLAIVLYSLLFSATGVAFRAALEATGVVKPEPARAAATPPSAPLPAPKPVALSPDAANAMLAALDSPEAIRRRAQQHLKDHKYDEAIADYTVLIAKDPANAGGYNDRGFVYDSAGQYDKAIADFDEAIRRKPDYGVAFNNRGFARANQGDRAAAVQDYGRAIAVAPDWPLPYGNRGLVYLQAGKYEDAVADFGAALERQPPDAKVYLNHRARALAALRRYDKAVADYARVLRLDPRNGTAYAGRADANYGLGAYAAALQDLNRAIELAPADLVLRRDRGIILLKVEKPAAAVADFDRVLAANPNDALTLRQRGIAHAALNEWTPASADLGRAAEISPGDLATWNLYTRALVGAGDADRSRAAVAKMFERFADTKNRQEADQTIWACVLTPDGGADRDRVLALAEKFAAANPKDYSLAVNYGAALYRSGKYAAAVDQMKKAAAVQGKGGTALDGYFAALAHHRLGEPALAAKDLARAQDWVERNFGKALRREKGAPALPWNQRLEIEALKTEAEAAVRPMPAARPEG